jgi:hypothetical protein
VARQAPLDIATTRHLFPHPQEHLVQHASCLTCNGAAADASAADAAADAAAADSKMAAPGGQDMLRCWLVTRTACTQHRSTSASRSTFLRSSRLKAALWATLEWTAQELRKCVRDASTTVRCSGAAPCWCWGPGRLLPGPLPVHCDCIHWVVLATSVHGAFALGPLGCSWLLFSRCHCPSLCVCVCSAAACGRACGSLTLRGCDNHGNEDE